MTTPYQPHSEAPAPAQPQSPPQGYGYPDPQAQPYQQPYHQQSPQQGGQPYQQDWQGAGDGGGGGYTSPIPVRGTHLGHAIASEWTKIRTVRSTMWTLGVMLVLVIGVGSLTALALDGSANAEMPLLAGGLFGLMLGQICVITLGVLVVTSEYGTGMIRSTLTACPARSRVLTAKALVFFALSFVMTLAATGLTALIQSSLMEGKPVAEWSSLPADSVSGGALAAADGEWLNATVGAALYVALLGLLSLAVGALLRHSAGAITTMLGIILLPLLLALFMQTENLRDVQEKLIEYSPLNGLASLYGIPFLEQPGDGSGWDLLWILAGVTAAALIGAYAALTTRDV